MQCLFAKTAYTNAGIIIKNTSHNVAIYNYVGFGLRNTNNAQYRIDRANILFVLPQKTTTACFDSYCYTMGFVAPKR